MNPLCGAYTQKNVDRKSRAVRDGRVTDRQISTRRSGPAVLEHTDLSCVSHLSSGGGCDRVRNPDSRELFVNVELFAAAG